MKTVLVVGASGDVGRGVCAVMAEAGWQVIASARNGAKLEEAVSETGSGHIVVVSGDLSSAEGAAQLWRDAQAMVGRVDAVVVATSAPLTQCALLDMEPAQLLATMQTNVMTHFHAARSFIPQLAPDGVFIGIGGGTADFLMPKGAHISMAQAALRMMYRGLAKETAKVGPAVRELMIVSMVNGASRRAVADPAWVTDRDVGNHVLAILKSPDSFPGPVLTLQSREQAGHPDGATRMQPT